MNAKQIRQTATAGILVLGLAVAGCETIPEERSTRGAVIGGAAGAAGGALLGGSEDRLVGAVLGGLLGAGAGYVIGAQQDRIREQDREAAERAAAEAQRNPATADQASQAETADINGDGFVTLDEVVAMNRAGLSDEEMIQRMEATNQVFELTEGQENYLRQQGVSDRVITEMAQVNRHLIEEQPGDDVIGRDPAA